MIWNTSVVKNTTNLHNGILVFNIVLWTYDEFFYVCSDISYFFLTFKYYKMLLFDRFKFRVEKNFVIITILHWAVERIFLFLNEWKCEGNEILEINIVQSNNNIALKVCLHQKLLSFHYGHPNLIFDLLLNILIKCSLNKLTCWQFSDMGKKIFLLTRIDLL